MTKFRPNPTLLLVIITAFLAMQWSTSHIHLATQHDHDGNHHQHYTETHSHLLADHHADNIDSSHQTGNFNLVELDYEYFTPTVKKKTPTTVIIGPVLQQLTIFQRVSVKLPVILNTRLNHLSRSIVSPRAPPRFT